MDRTERLERWMPIALLACVAATLLPGLSRFGVWDPWELSTAEVARRLSDGEGVQGAIDANTWLASVGFRVLGVDEWAGRLPVALSALLLLVLLITAGGRILGRRAGLYAAAIAAATPLFALNARPIFGSAPAFLLQTACGLLLSLAVLDSRGSAGRRLAMCAGGLIAGALAVADGGVLRGLLPPLLATAVTAALHGVLADDDDRTRRGLGWLLVAAAAAAVAGVCITIAHDLHGPSVWTGGSPQQLVAPSFEASLQRVFHGFAPWSALLPLSVAVMVWPDVPAERRMWALWLTLWAATGYAAHTLFVSRYGAQDTFLPIGALSMLVALALCELERTARPQWAATCAGVLLCILLLRDYAVSPDSALDSLSLASLKAPESVHPKRVWGGLLTGFVLLLGLVLGGGPAQRPRLADPWRAVARQWRSSRGAKLWLCLAAAVALAVVAASIAAWAAPRQLGMTSMVSKWVRRAGLLPLAMVAVVAAVPVVRHFYARLGTLRAWPLLLVGLLFGAYTAQGFLPKLSAHYSPRSVFETYNRLARAAEPLAQFKVSGRAATYYAKGDVDTVADLKAMVEHLKGKTRSWGVLPGDELARLDRLYRKSTGRHVFVADATSQKAMLVSSHPIEGHPDQNYLADAVLDAPPKTTQHPLQTVFDDKIRLLGYDLKPASADGVGAGEKLEITWYFEALQAIPGHYEIFVHIDGPDRVHGDHVPVGGKYPVRLWDRGDVVRDRHTVAVPAGTKAGTYTLYVGLYAGEKRMAVTEGPKDKGDRARAGVLRIH